MPQQEKKKRPSLTAPVTGDESDQALKTKANKLQTKATKAARKESKRRSKDLSGPPASAAGATTGGGAQTGTDNREEPSGVTSGLKTAADYVPTPGKFLADTATGAAEAGGRVADYTAEQVGEAETPGMKAANAIGAPLGGMSIEALQGAREDVGGSIDTGYNFMRGLGGATSPVGGEERAKGAAGGGQTGGGQPDQAPKGPGQKAVGVEERNYPNSDESYYVNKDVDEDKYGQAIYSGTREGATEEGFDKDVGGGGLSIMGGGRSSRTPSAPPSRSVELDQAEQAMAQGNTGRARSLLQSPEEGQATAEQQETSRLRRQANQQPSLSMPFDQMLQTTAERNSAQQQLKTRAQAQADKKVAQTEAAQSERESQRDTWSDLMTTRMENQGEEQEYEFDTIKSKGEKGLPTEQLVAMDPRTGQASNVEPTSTDEQGLAEAAQQGGEVAQKAGQAYKKKHGDLPGWFKQFQKEATTPTANG